MGQLTPPRLLLHERLQADETVERTWLEVDRGMLYLRIDERPPRQIAPPILEAVMNRYGKPLADEVILSGPLLELETGATVQLFRHRALYDVIAKDYVVYTAPGREPVAELAVSVTAALSYLLKE